MLAMSTIAAVEFCHISILKPYSSQAKLPHCFRDAYSHVCQLCSHSNFADCDVCPTESLPSSSCICMPVTNDYAKLSLAATDDHAKLS